MSSSFLHHLTWIILWSTSGHTLYEEKIHLPRNIMACCEAVVRHINTAFHLFSTFFLCLIALIPNLLVLGLHIRNKTLALNPHLSLHILRKLASKAIYWREELLHGIVKNVYILMLTFSTLNMKTCLGHNLISDAILFHIKLIFKRNSVE